MPILMCGSLGSYLHARVCVVATVVLVACRLQWGSTLDWHQPQKDSRQWPGPNESCSAVVVDTLHGDLPELWDGAL